MRRLNCAFPAVAKVHLFPMTHHVECVAILDPAAKGSDLRAAIRVVRSVCRAACTGSSSGSRQERHVPSRRCLRQGRPHSPRRADSMRRRSP